MKEKLSDFCSKVILSAREKMEREGGTTRDREMKKKLSDFCPKLRGWVQFLKSNTFYA
jgi:hypothetical protein